MDGPWTKYGTDAEPKAQGPWSKYETTPGPWTKYLHDRPPLPADSGITGRIELDDFGPAPPDKRLGRAGPPHQPNEPTMGPSEPLAGVIRDPMLPMGVRGLAAGAREGMDVVRGIGSGMQRLVQQFKPGDQPTPEVAGTAANLATFGVKPAPGGMGATLAPRPIEASSGMTVGDWLNLKPPSSGEGSMTINGVKYKYSEGQWVGQGPDRPIDPRAAQAGQQAVAKVADSAGPKPWEKWAEVYQTPEAKAAFKQQKNPGGDQAHYPAEMAQYTKEANADLTKKAGALGEGHAKPPVAIKAPTPSVPAGVPSHVASLIKKGNNFFADERANHPTHLPMDEPARMKRAKSLGFRTDLPLYHGAPNKFLEFDLSKATEGGIFATDNPNIAASYGGKHILPLWGKFQNPKTIENFGFYNTTKMKNVIAQAKADGHDSIIIKNIKDIGGNQTQYVFLKPENLRSKDAAAFDPAKVHSPNLLSAGVPSKPGVPALPSKSMQGIVKKSADDLNRIFTKHEAVKTEVLQEVRKLPEKVKALGQKFFEFLEPGHAKPTLTAEEKSIFKKYLQPWLERQRDLYEEIKKLAPGMFPKDYDPDYVHHLVQGKTPEFDEEIGVVSHQPVSPWFGGKTLPRSTRSLKNSKYYVIEDAKGNRRTAMLDDKGNLYLMQGKKPINVPAKDVAGDVEPGKNIKIGGKDYTIKRASVAEKENATNLKYYKDAYLSTLSNVERLEKVADALHLFETWKNDPEFMQFARKPGDHRPTPKGWDKTILPGWEGYRFHPRLMEAMNDWHAKPGEAWYENLKDLTHGVVGTLFLTPFRHMLNVGGHFYVGRGWGWLPQGWLPFVKHTGLAIGDTLAQGKFTKQMLKEGSALQLPRTLNADFNKQLLKGLGDNFTKNPKDWKWLWDKLNVKEEDVYKGWLKSSSTAMWFVSDVLMQSLVRERVAKGMPMPEAIRSAERDIPNYRINSRVIFQGNDETRFGRARGAAGRGASRYLQNSLFSVFGRYNNNKWRAIADMVSDIVGPKSTGAERVEAVGKALALASLVYMVYWPIDSVVKKLTGRQDKRSSPFGPVSPVDLAKQFGELVMLDTMKRLGATDDQVHATQLLQSAIGLSPGLDQGATQLFGHNPYTNQPIETPGERVQAAADTVNPFQIGSDLAGGKVSPLEELLKATIGMRSVPQPAPAIVQKRDVKANAKRKSQQPINRAIGEAGRKLQPFTPDAIVNWLLHQGPSS